MKHIVVRLDVMLARRKVKARDLAERIGITEANLSLLRTGKVKGVRFDTLALLCEALDCTPGDLLDIDSRRSKKRLHGAVINIHRLNEDVLVFTVVPLMYGEHLIDPVKGKILTATPPAQLNMSGPLPITDDSFGTGSRLPGVASAGR